MLKLNKMTDYAVLLLVDLFEDKGQKITVSELALRTKLAEPTISKILKQLSKSGLVTSHRGVYGGYSFDKESDDVSIANIITAIEGQMAVTSCIGHDNGDCSLESNCRVSNNWNIVNDAIYNALNNIKLTDMTLDNSCPSANVMVEKMNKKIGAV